MSLQLDLQVALEWPDLPSQVQLQQWAQAALTKTNNATNNTATELTIRIVDEAESSALNSAYRHKTGATNVLSFPCNATPPDATSRLLGDVVICAPVVIREALSQNKITSAHWAHMVVHGVLHLRGYDHQEEVAATHMEALETQLLAELGYPDPYGEIHERRPS